ncbi:hypothetical protein KIPB_000102 [Kipferlia bialata]|uniref:Uncharacterized protein n=1 Tax=Kipferlia bialata TaxID=797122 RepID=A0A9K3GEG9_9EUKA|nr:hypothetical protein KIPB_000102 [Kipferlia bialata]|eukprot:g102.t1
MSSESSPPLFVVEPFVLPVLDPGVDGSDTVRINAAVSLRASALLLCHGGVTTDDRALAEEKEAKAKDEKEEEAETVEKKEEKEEEKEEEKKE